MDFMIKGTSSHRVHFMVLEEGLLRSSVKIRLLALKSSHSVQSLLKLKHSSLTKRHSIGSRIPSA